MKKLIMSFSILTTTISFADSGRITVFDGYYKVDYENSDKNCKWISPKYPVFIRSWVNGKEWGHIAGPAIQVRQSPEGWSLVDFVGINNNPRKSDRTRDVGDLIPVIERKIENTTVTYQNKKLEKVETEKSSLTLFIPKTVQSHLYMNQDGSVEYKGKVLKVNSNYEATGASGAVYATCRLIRLQRR